MINLEIVSFNFGAGINLTSNQSLSSLASGQIFYHKSNPAMILGYCMFFAYRPETCMQPQIQLPTALFKTMNAKGMQSLNVFFPVFCDTVQICMFRIISSNMCNISRTVRPLHQARILFGFVLLHKSEILSTVKKKNQFWPNFFGIWNQVFNSSYELLYI